MSQTLTQGANNESDGEENGEENGFQILNFYRLFDVVSQITLIPWNQLYDLDIREFMTYVHYANLKYKEQQQQLKRYGTK